ncbi:serine/arginine repetitive matrix protein 3-like [Schistocerca serialis cubense]|uniref:serine/arginine repetitive matrix protein 3-like n=1 Tax=Schistocerca serialis cubense TaxID=2023355 RepID=UPI00214F23ED|nr:serine/arginine repetitive matrix protein 3-like [Schistocerca serialis cubense]
MGRPVSAAALREGRPSRAAARSRFGTLAPCGQDAAPGDSGQRTGQQRRAPVTVHRAEVTEESGLPHKSGGPATSMPLTTAIQKAPRERNVHPQCPRVSGARASGEVRRLCRRCRRRRRRPAPLDWVTSAKAAAPQEATAAAAAGSCHRRASAGAVFQPTGIPTLMTSPGSPRRPRVRGRAAPGDAAGPARRVSLRASAGAAGPSKLDAIMLGSLAQRGPTPLARGRTGSRPDRQTASHAATAASASAAPARPTAGSSRRLRSTSLTVRSTRSTF